ncbi:hypothetical protein TRFO_07248 [Tritrichomonas foetus]|uniref:Uncharacterized protein n=1 Tax=Tritrichomonas foetus TaxID=1144522 RepID=A0A1J4JSP2_9EUKA|nr:hypothetical protein TRFO_07248 [Tritrichomonas foetus]|eukprot:OHT02075.1 hypothetical protein TRFO_07248 [Tritrichomonas foetus]
MSSASFSEEDIAFSSEGNDESMPDADPYLISPMILSVTAKTKPPPQLIDFAGSNKDLQLIANNLHQLFNAPGFIKYSTESRQNLELVIRSFVNDSIKAAAFQNYRDFSADQSDVKTIQEELFEAKKELENYKYLVKKIEKDRNDLSAKNEELQDEIDTLYSNNATTLNQINVLKRERDIQITDIKNENDQLKEKLREIQDDLKIKDYASLRNQAQFNEITNQATQRSMQIIKLNDKIKEKDEKIENLSKQIQDLKIKNQNLEDDTSKLAAYLNTTRANLTNIKKKVKLLAKERENDKTPKTNANIRNAFKSISEQFNNQSEELVKLRENQMNCTTLIQKQFELITEYDRQINLYQNMKHQNYTLTNQVSSLKAELLQIKEKYEVLNEITKNLVAISDAEKPEELPLVFIKMKEFGCIENQRLVNAFEDQLRFMISVVNSDILYGKQNIPLSEDSSFKEKLQVEISRCRQFILENTIESDETDTLIETNEVNNRNDFAFLSTQVIRNEILRKYCEKLKSESEVLHKAAEIVGCSDDPLSICDYLSSQNGQLETFFDNAFEIMKEEKSDNPYEQILIFLEINNNAFEELKETLKFDCTISEIPIEVERLMKSSQTNKPNNSRKQSNSPINEIRNSNSINNNNFNNNNSNDTNNTNDTMNRTETLPSLTDNAEQYGSIKEIDIESIHASSKSKIEGKIQTYQTALKKLKKENTNLKKKIEDLQEKIEDSNKRDTLHRQTLNAMNKNYYELENRITELTKQNDNLHHEIEAKAKSGDERVFKALDQERAQHAIEVENIRNRFEVINERQKEQIQKKKERVSILKKKLKEVISSFEDAFKKQKETIRVLREQLDEANERVSSKDPSMDVSQLESQLHSAQSENNNLQMKIKQAKDEQSKAMAIRDTFWKAQVALVEQNSQKSFEKEKQKLLENIASTIHCEPTMESIIDTIKGNNQILETKDFSKSVVIDTHAQKQLEEWEKWSRSLFTNVNNGEVFAHSAKELRFVLGEMILSSISHHQLVSRLESLRTQKVMLLTNRFEYKISKKKSPPEIRSLLVAAMFVVRLRRRTNQVTPRLFQTSLSP